jgi:S-adenosylmethionine uptake transporter
VGVLIVVRPGLMPLGFAHFTALCSALFGSVYFAILRKTGGAERMTVLMLYPLLAQVVVTAMLLPFFYKPMPVAHIGLTGLMAILGFCGTLLVIGAYRHAPAAVVAPMQYGQIIWASLFGILYFGEPMDAATVTGIAIVIAAGIYIMRSSHQLDQVIVEKHQDAS